jgi:hypothetical protein
MSPLSSSASSSPLFAIALIAMVLLSIAAMWRLFGKAGEAGWKCIVPIYGAVVMLRIVGRPWWWLVLLLVPVVNLIFGSIVCFDLAKAFGKGAGTGLGILLLGPIFILLLAFGDARYVGNAKRPAFDMKRAA